MGSKRRSEAIPPNIAIRNDHMSVPVVSAIQPAMIGEIMVPIPRYTVHKPMILPAACLEKKSEAQAAYIDQQAP